MALPDKARERASDAGYTVTPTLEEASAGPQTETPSFGTLVQAGLRGTRDDYEYSLHTFYKSPCFRQALLWGIGLGAAIALHRYKETRSIVRATDGFMLSWTAVSLGGWLICRRNELRQMSAVHTWQKEKLVGVDAGTDSYDGNNPPLPKLATEDSPVSAGERR